MGSARAAAAARLRGGVVRGSTRSGAWSTGSDIGSGQGARGVMCRSGTGRGGGCTHCSRAGRWLGVWERVEDALRARADAAGHLSWQVSVDSTTARAHVHAAGARRDSVDRVAGRTRSPRPRVAPGAGGAPRPTPPSMPAPRSARVLLTPGQAGDSPEMIAVLHRHPSGPSRARATTQPPRPGPGRQGLLLPREPGLARARTSIKATIPVPADQAGHRQRRGSHRRTTPGVRRRTATRTDTPSNAASATSNTTAASPPATTSSPSASPPPSTSPASTTGSEDFRNRT